MHRSSSLVSLAAALVASLALAGCGASPDPQSDDALVIRGSAGSPSAAPGAAPQGIPPGSLTGNPAAIKLGLYKLYLGARSDCSDLQLIEDYGSTALEIDLAQNPILFSANPPDGAYNCVAFRMSDLVRVSPAQSFGACEAGTEYVADVYREGQAGYRDVNGFYSTGRGTDSDPQEDAITIVLSRDPTAAIDQGYSAHQVIPLAASLVVPGTSTFFWNGNGTVVSEAGQCGIYPGHPEFN